MPRGVGHEPDGDVDADRVEGSVERGGGDQVRDELLDVRLDPAWPDGDAYPACWAGVHPEHTRVTRHAHRLGRDGSVRLS